MDGYTPVFYHSVPSVQPEYLWIVIVGGICCFMSAWGIGANDTCNAWGSTVGSRGISVRNAAILAGTFEVVGAFALGATVGGTLKSGIVPPKFYCTDNYELVVRMIGMLCVDFGAGLWVCLATKFGMPVSTTHAAVGGICGFGIVTRGWGAVVWWQEMGKIFISWASSPLLSGFIGYVIQFLALRFLFRGPPGSIYRKNLLWLPAIGGLFLGVAAVFAFYIGGKGNANVKELPAWPFIVVFFAVAVGMIIILILVSKYLRKRWNIDLDAYAHMDDAAAKEDTANLDDLVVYDGDGVPVEREFYNVTPEPGPVPSTPLESPQPGVMTGSDAPAVLHEDSEDTADKKGLTKQRGATAFNSENLGQEDVYAGMNAERIAAEELWKPLCWIVASTESFAHGANDVGNAIGPYAALIDSYNNVCPKGTKEIPYWVLGLGAAGILIGLVTYGHRVMRTLGVEIAVITPQRACASEMATVLSVLIATSLAIPVSTTHCAVGGIAGVAIANFGFRQVNWKTLRNVAICIVVTVPACALIVGALFGFFHAAVFGASFPGPYQFKKYCNSTSAK